MLEHLASSSVEVSSSSSACRSFLSRSLTSNATLFMSGKTELRFDKKQRFEFHQVDELTLAGVATVGLQYADTIEAQF